MRRRSRRRPPTSPAFQLYVRDWLSSTLGMAREVKGAYIDLLCWAWDNGPLPDDAGWRQRVFGGSARTAARLWAALRHRWRRTAGGWVNPRLERQRKQLADYRAHAKKAARARWEQVDTARIRPHASGMAPGSAHGRAQRMLRSTLRADARALPDRSSSSSSSSSSEDLKKPAPPVSSPAFRVYCAIAGIALEEAQTTNLGIITDHFKTICARQQLRYDGEIARKAIDAVLHVRAKRRA